MYIHGHIIINVNIFPRMQREHLPEDVVEVTHMISDAAEGIQLFA